MESYLVKCDDRDVHDVPSTSDGGVDTEQCETLIKTMRESGPVKTVVTKKYVGRRVVGINECGDKGVLCQVSVW